MSEVLDSYDFSPKGRPPGSKWDAFLDGRIHFLRAGEDFTTQPQHVRIRLYERARLFGKKVRVHIRDGDLIVQAYDWERA